MSFVLPTAFYRRTSAGPLSFEPSEATIGPWSAEHQHGGPPIALLAHALRCHPATTTMELVRLTVEILGPIPVQPCQIEVEVLRPGKRIELLKATLRSGGKTVLTAQAWRMERLPGISPPVPDPYELPPMTAPEATRFFPGISYFPYVHALEWRFEQGAYDELGPATVWARLRIPLIEGEPTHGVEGLVTMLDSANGVSAELDIRQWSFVPVDFNLNLHRMPQGPWFGMQAQSHISDGGIGLTHTIAFDSKGPVGRSLHSLFVRPRHR